ncbi:hypothetical protein PHYSODRAFT_505967, partial [Phytophthora sojae]
LQQTPNQLWRHRNAITEYQAWVNYRLAVSQLNLYFDGRQTDNSCRKLASCKGHKETLAHIFWECPCANTCWEALVTHWTGQRCQQHDLAKFKANCMSRSPPKLSSVMQARLQATFTDEVEAYVIEWNRVWWILSSICITVLWIQRNRVTHQQGQVTQQGSKQEFWKTGLQQLRALARRERWHPHTKIQGTRLLLCLGMLARPLQEAPPQGIARRHRR